jgi:hypothetical protein
MFKLLHISAAHSFPIEKSELWLRANSARGRARPAREAAGVGRGGALFDPGGPPGCGFLGGGGGA